MGWTDRAAHPHCQPFRNMLAHPKTTPHLNSILGEGWRLDHGPGLIAMGAGCEGGTLHGGAANRPPAEQYFWKNGQIMTGLTVIEYLLADEGPGDGGVCIVPGSVGLFPSARAIPLPLCNTCSGFSIVWLLPD